MTTLIAIDPAALGPHVGTTAELDALAEHYGCELWADRDDDAPTRWAVWCAEPTALQDAELVGAGGTLAEAISEARAQLATWEEKTP
jgi:hypothetical protein